jgi:branched-chain amino acid transport system substrate-binding protein
MNADSIQLRGPAPRVDRSAPPGDTATGYCCTPSQVPSTSPTAVLRSIFGRLCVPLVLLTLAACDSSKDPLTLGLAAPLGIDDLYGENTLMGAQLAINEINAQGGIDGRPLKLSAVTDSANDSTAIRAAERLSADPEVLAVVGHAYSGPMLAAAPIYQETGLVAVGTSATSTRISREGDYIFRVGSSDSSNATSLARTALQLGKRVAILYSNEDYGQSLEAVLRRALRDAGAELIASDPYLEEMPETEFEPYLRRLAARGVDVILVAGYDKGASKIIPRARALMPGVQIMGGDGLELLVGMGSAFDGTYVGMLYHPEASPSARSFAAAYRAAFQREPDSSAATAYDAVYLLARAMQAGHRTRREIRDYLAGVGREGGSPVFEGVSGPVRFDENGDPVEKPFTVVVIRNGKFVLPEGQTS